jgi:Mn-dependent DtxR family transcriptional regulator
MKKLTTRQQEVLTEIYNLTQRGLAPTFAELRNRLGVSSNQSVKDFINSLLVKGYIKQQKYKARSIIITKKGLKEINNFNKKIEFFPNFDPVAIQYPNQNSQEINNGSSFFDELHEDYNISFNKN